MREEVSNSAIFFSPAGFARLAEPVTHNGSHSAENGGPAAHRKSTENGHAVVRSEAVSTHITRVLTLSMIAEMCAALTHAARASAIHELLSPTGDQCNGRLVSPIARAEKRDAESAVFRCDGDYWTIAYRGLESRLKDSKGLRYIAQLLANPNTEISALTLAATVENGYRSGAVRPIASEVGQHSSSSLGDAGELLDAQAKGAYRRRLEELREELDQAEAFNDPERAIGAREEMQCLAAELSRAVGLGERDRRAACPAERARVNVTRAIKQSLRRLAEENAPLGSHLIASIKTGAVCRYLPGPNPPISWLQ
jgi:hypothetical protein